MFRDERERVGAAVDIRRRNPRSVVSCPSRQSRSGLFLLLFCFVFGGNDPNVSRGRRNVEGRGRVTWCA